MTRARSKTPRVDKAVELVRSLDRGVTVLPQVSADSARKLLWLNASGRPFLRPARDMKQSAVRYVRAELSFEPSASPSKLRAAMAAGVRAAVLLRFTAQQGVPLRPLTARYLAHKIRRGLDRRIGIAHWKLLAELSSAKWMAR